MSTQSRKNSVSNIFFSGSKWQTIWRKKFTNSTGMLNKSHQKWNSVTMDYRTTSKASDQSKVTLRDRRWQIFKLSKPRLWHPMGLTPLPYQAMWWCQQRQVVTRLCQKNQRNLKSGWPAVPRKCAASTAWSAWPILPPSMST